MKITFIWAVFVPWLLAPYSSGDQERPIVSLDHFWNRAGKLQLSLCPHLQSSMPLEDTTRMFSRPYGYLYQETPRAPASWEGRKGILVLLCENRDIDYANPLDNPERWGGEGSGWGVQDGGTHVHSWLIHVDVWQKPLQYCKVISLRSK